jgi:hypothetical protein
MRPIAACVSAASPPITGIEGPWSLARLFAMKLSSQARVERDPWPPWKPGHRAQFSIRRSTSSCLYQSERLPKAASARPDRPNLVPMKSVMGRRKPLIPIGPSQCPIRPNKKTTAHARTHARGRALSRASCALAHEASGRWDANRQHSDSTCVFSSVPIFVPCTFWNGTEPKTAGRNGHLHAFHPCGLQHSSAAPVARSTTGACLSSRAS